MDNEPSLSDLCSAPTFFGTPLYTYVLNLVIFPVNPPRVSLIVNPPCVILIINPARRPWKSRRKIYFSALTQFLNACQG